MAIIEVQKLQKKYGNLEVLKSIDLSIEEGEVVCIIGPSGSGKSTFLRCLNRLEKIKRAGVVAPTLLPWHFCGPGWSVT